MVYKFNSTTFYPRAGYGCIYRYDIVSRGHTWKVPKYIGQTRGALRNRHQAHMSKSARGTLIDKTLKTHDYSLYVIWTGLIEDLDDAEMYFIQYYGSLFPNGLNMEGGGNVAKCVSEETRRKMSEMDKLRDHTVGYKPIYQYTLSGEFVKEYPALTLASVETGISMGHISQCTRGIRNSAGGYRWTYSKGELYKYRTHKDYNSGQYPKRGVKQYNLDFTFVAEYSGITEAERQTGFNHRGISRCAGGERKTYKGYVWRYSD